MAEGGCILVLLSLVLFICFQVSFFCCLTIADSHLLPFSACLSTFIFSLWYILVSSDVQRGAQGLGGCGCILDVGNVHAHGWFFLFFALHARTMVLRCLTGTISVTVRGRISMIGYRNMQVPATADCRSSIWCSCPAA